MVDSQMSVHDIKSTVLNLPQRERQDVITALLWSLPRDDVIELHARLSRMMQKDIVALLPVELSLRILSMLEPDDLLRCKSVSRTWAVLCDDQSVWHKKCLSHSPPLYPALTTWADLTAHRELLHRGQSDPSPGSSFMDESFENMSDEDLTGVSRAGLPPRVLASTGSSAAGSPGPSRGPNRPARRRIVWERPWGGLPTYQRAANAVVPAQMTPSGSDSFARSQEPVISSHLRIPTVMPKVNYKHLYLVRRTLLRRMKDSRPADVEAAAGGRRPGTTWNPMVSILTSVSSSAAGGLPGHSEIIYSLQLISRHMKINMVTAEQDDFMYIQTALSTAWPAESSPFSDVFGTPVAPGWPGLGSAQGHGSHSPASTQVTSIVGRDWLLSGSRDTTLRLWQLDCVTPRVVKVFAGGHSGSILTHFVVQLPVKAADGSSQTRASRSSSPSKSPSPSSPGRGGQPATRLLAFSGGSEGRICVWDIEHGDGTPERVIEAHTDSVMSIRGDDERIVSCAKDRTIRVFDIHTLEQLLVIENAEDGHRGMINAVGLTKDFIISASGDRSIKVWSITDGRLLATHDAHLRGISSMGFDPSPADDSWVPPPEMPNAILRGTVVTGSADATVKTFHIVQLPPDAEYSSEALTFRDMLDLQNHRHFDDDYDGGRDSTAEGGSTNGGNGDPDSPNGRSGALRLLITPGVEYRGICSCLSPTIRTTAGCMRCLNRGHTELVRGVHLGQQLTLSASYDSTIKMWDRTTGHLIFDFGGCHQGRVCAITGDNVRVVSGGLDAKIVIVDFGVGLDTSFV